MGIQKVIFPPEVQEFATEIHKHPELIKLLDQLQERDLGNILAATCTYLGIEIDGTYGGQETIKLIEILMKALHKKRTIIIH